MNKVALKLILAVCLTIGTAATGYAFTPADNKENVEAEVSTVTVITNQSSVRIIGAQGQTLEVYKITGIHIEKVKIDSNDKTIDLNLQKGCYILKIGKVVRKISVK